MHTAFPSFCGFSAGKNTKEPPVNYNSAALFRVDFLFFRALPRGSISFLKKV